MVKAKNGNTYVFVMLTTHSCKQVMGCKALTVQCTVETIHHCGSCNSYLQTDYMHPTTMTRN